MTTIRDLKKRDSIFEALMCAASTAVNLPVAVSKILMAHTAGCLAAAAAVSPVAGVGRVRVATAARAAAGGLCGVCPR